MRLPKKFIAIKCLCLAALLLCTVQVFAMGSVGVVSQVEGTLMVKNSAGVTRFAAKDTPIDVGDILISQTASFAKIRFIDDSEITLKPDTQLTVEAFIYDKKSGGKQGALLSLSTGGVLVITGLTAVNSSEGFQLLAPSLQDPIGTITADRHDIGVFYVEYKAASTKDNLAWYPSNRTPIMLAMNETTTRTDAVWALGSTEVLLAEATSSGLYVNVLDGIIHVTNGGGTQNFTAGQFGFTSGFQQPPIILSNNPGMQFSPPASFSSSSQSKPSGTNNSRTVDCEVR